MGSLGLNNGVAPRASETRSLGISGVSERGNSMSGRQAQAATAQNIAHLTTLLPTLVDNLRSNPSDEAASMERNLIVKEDNHRKLALHVNDW